jgi:transposase-like protein
MSKKNVKRKRYTAEFKAEAVRLFEGRGDRTVAEVAQSLGVAENMLHSWKRQQEAAGTHDRANLQSRSCSGCGARMPISSATETRW